MGQAELLCRDSMYSLHVTVTREFDVPEPDTVDTVVGVDINERNVALTALDHETMQTKGTLVLDYGQLKQERQCYHIITTRCQEHGKTNIYRKLGDEEERFTCALPVQINAITDIDALSYLLTRTLIPSRHRASHKMLVHTRIIGHTTAAAVAAIDERIIKNTTNAFI